MNAVLFILISTTCHDSSPCNFLDSLKDLASWGLTSVRKKLSKTFCFVFNSRPFKMINDCTMEYILFTFFKFPLKSQSA